MSILYISYPQGDNNIHESTEKLAE